MPKYSIEIIAEFDNFDEAFDHAWNLGMDAEKAGKPYTEVLTPVLSN